MLASEFLQLPPVADSAECQCVAVGQQPMMRGAPKALYDIVHHTSCSAGAYALRMKGSVRRGPRLDTSATTSVRNAGQWESLVRVLQIHGGRKVRMV